MTLEIIDVEQCTDEWFTARAGIITASAVKGLLTPTLRVADNDYARAMTAALVAERITGVVEQMSPTPDMWRGIDEEPRARDKYSEVHAPAVECGFMVRREDTWTLGYSPDGLVGDDGLIEIKAPRQKKHVQTVLADAVPSEHMAQLQAGLLVTGRKWIDFISWHGGMHMYVKRVLPDPAWQAAIVLACQQFETTAAAMTAAYDNATKGLVMTEPAPEMEMSLS